jgi:N-terminal acetyltransferase B complex catalytic subunit
LVSAAPETYFCFKGWERKVANEMIDMRKPLSRDAGRRSVRPNGREMLVSRYEVS